MVSIIDQRHQLIKRAVTQQPESVVSVTIGLWDRLSVALITLIGEDGFQSLLARAIYLNEATYPWLVLHHMSQQSDSAFIGLKISLEGQELTIASTASVALMTTFIDLLALLIGDLLTASIMRSAWGDEVLGETAKEFTYE